METPKFLQRLEHGMLCSEAEIVTLSNRFDFSLENTRKKLPPSSMKLLG